MTLFTVHIEGFRSIRNLSAMVHSHQSSRTWLVRSLCASLTGALLFSHGGGQLRAEAQGASIVDRLSGPSFQDRLDAEDEALQIGDAVLPALLKAEQSPDAELRLRARQLIQRIEKDGLDQSIAAFLAPNSTTELPGWSMVCDVIDDTPDHRNYYASLLSAEPTLALAFRRPDQLAAELTRRQQEYGQAMLGGGGSNQPPFRIAALLLLLLHPDLDVPDLVCNDATRMVMYGISVGGESVGDRFIKALAEQWVITPRSGTAQQRFELGSRMALPGMVVPALEIIQQRPIPTQASAYFSMLARYGGPDEMAELEKLLGDTTEQWSHERDNLKTVTQVRDLALAALIEMTGQKAEEYGLKGFDRDGNRRIRNLRPSFESAEARDAALEKWKLWSAVHLKKYWKFPGVAVEGILL